MHECVAKIEGALSFGILMFVACFAFVDIAPVMAEPLDQVAQVSQPSDDVAVIILREKRLEHIHAVKKAVQKHKGKVLTVLLPNVLRARLSEAQAELLRRNPMVDTVEFGVLDPAACSHHGT
ncbi:MAG: hypothetical protein OET79_12210, partial [Nitrospirota bacterium]|nr:hypothetical protein [Nitrospirota bacterium]